MGWHIHLVKNTVVINKKIAEDLVKVESCSGTWDEEEDLLDHEVGCRDEAGVIRLYFNDDHMEHMDYVWHDDVQAVLKKHKVKGDVCFSSSEGDNRGSSWGYRFDGKGGMVQLRGVTLFKEVAPKSPVKKPIAKKRLGTLTMVCVSCYENTSLPDPCDNVGKPRGRDIRKHGSDPRYCGTCGSGKYIKKVRV